MNSNPYFADSRQTLQEVIIVATLSPTEGRALQRRAKAGEVQRLHAGVYLVCGSTHEEMEACVRRNWQRIAGAIVPGGVITHISAMTTGLLSDGRLTLSHPTMYRKTVALPGLILVLMHGPGPLAGDMPLGNTGLYWASPPRMFLENLGRKAPSKAGREEVEHRLIEVLNASGEGALNRLRDDCAALAESLGRPGEVALLRTIIGALLGTHERGELKTKDGQMLARGTPVDQERMMRFEALASFLRGVALPNVTNTLQQGIPRHNFAFIESYFSNYVEGTKFSIEEARDIVLLNRVVESRPKDSHDILGVFRLATTPPFRNSPPVAGEDFLVGLETWHADMLRERPEVNPGKIKLKVNYAGTSKFVEPALVRGTLEEGSRLALSVPEGFARAAYYAFLVSEVHPFEDGNGRLSRLVMNAELSRVGLHRIIIPTLFHPQYVDCARLLTRSNEPASFVAALAKMARWCAQFNYGDLDELIRALRKTAAMEESSAQYKLLNLDDSSELKV
ncbi:MAG: Fic family protein [Duganella sp.]